jgi:hypothetical protein
MTIAEQMGMVVAALTEQLKALKGRAYPAGDVINVLDELRAAPGGPSAGVLFWTEDPQGEYPELGKVMRVFKVVLSRSKGFKIITGESLTDGVAGGPPMFDLVEIVRNAVLRVRMSDESGELQIPVYRGTGPFEAQGLVLDAYEIRFGLFAQNPTETDEALEVEE